LLAVAQDEIPAVLPPPAKAGSVEVELPSGVKLRLTGEVDAITLRRILSALS
jgi:transposase